MANASAVRFLDRTTPPHLVTLVLLTAVSAAALNVFLPSLPSMTVYFDTDYRLMQLSVALYLAVNAALQLVIGPISDRFGRRPRRPLGGCAVPLGDAWLHLGADGRGLSAVPHGAGG
jgi:DHA1 family bicyclomycin/chloramphenicol resistance-like MFS transporter